MNIVKYNNVQTGSNSGSYYTKYFGNNITLIIEEPVGLDSCIRTVMYKGMIAKNISNETAEIFIQLMNGQLSNNNTQY